MKASEINEGIMQNVAYAGGRGVGHTVNTVGAAAGATGRGLKRAGGIVKNVGKAAHTAIGGALDALSNKDTTGLGKKMYKQAIGQKTDPETEKIKIDRSMLPRPGEMYDHPKFGPVKVLAIGKSAVKLDTTRQIGHEIVVPLK